MNNNPEKNPEDLRSFLLMSELEKGEPITQREIAGRCGIALGLVNAYLKSLVQKGFVTVKSYPRNRFAYLLTPKGFTEKSRLALQHLSNFNRLYSVARQDSLAIFKHLSGQGVEAVAFCGLDDLTEIFYLSLQEAGLRLAAVMDATESGGRFLSHEVVDLDTGIRTGSWPIILTSLQRADGLKQALLEKGVPADRIRGPALSFEEILRRNIAARSL